jgi:hypothetical protein
VSDAGLIGGGSIPCPGAVSHAHHSVLFLDELPKSRRDVLVTWRQPLEDETVILMRALPDPLCLRQPIRLAPRFGSAECSNSYMHGCPCR